MENSIRKGQILIMVLIVLMILGVTVVAVTNGIIRDTQESLQGTNYEQLYADSEAQVLNIAQNLDFSTGSNLKSRVIDILTDTGINSDTCNTTNYTADVDALDHTACTIYDLIDPNSEVVVKIEDLRTIERVEVGKDESITFKIDDTLPGPTPDTLLVSLFQDVDTQLPAGHGVSIEVSVDFSYVGTDGQTRYSSARGVFDPNGVFPGAISNNLMTITSMGPAQNRFNFRISDVRSRLIDPAYYTTNFVTGSVEVHGVRFKLVSDSIQSVFMDVVVMSGGYQDIVQSRKFEGTAYILNENGEIFGAQPFIQGSVPAFKSPPVFDYILRSGTTID